MTMKRMKVSTVVWMGVLTMVFLLAFAAAASARMIIEDNPYAPYTSPTDPSLLPYYSTINGANRSYAPYTDASILAYYSTINGAELSYAPYTSVEDMISRSLLPRWRILR